MSCPKAVQPCVHALFVNAFIGLPCPKNTAGIRVAMLKLLFSGESQHTPGWDNVLTGSMMCWILVADWGRMHRFACSAIPWRRYSTFRGTWPTAAAGVDIVFGAD